MKRFNTTGPIQNDIHYAISPLSRWDMDEIEALIVERQYFVLHAPRQTGKTSCLLALMDKLNAEGNYTALYVNIEPAQAARENVEAGMRTIVGWVAQNARRHLGDERLRGWVDDTFYEFGPHGALQGLLAHWSEENHKPIVLLMDEVDTLIGDTLISVLRQLRAGYTDRPAAYPQTVLLCGVRDVRDYRIHTAGGEIITGGSAFNIKSDSLRLGNFHHEDVVTLYGQHTQKTGQAFEDGVFDYVFEQTNGQPWLVNALGREACFKDRSARDRTCPITMEIMMEARERLIERRDTHLDQLVHHLRESRVHKVISELLGGDIEPGAIPPGEDDQLYVRDLGLIRTRPQTEIANPIYREIIPRALTWTIQTRIPQETAWYIKENGSLDIPRLLNGFQQFFRENSEVWLDGFHYIEAGPQLLMQSFLQRIVNGGGRIEREYGLGRKRTDLLIQWPLDKTLGFYGPVQRVVIELKIQHKSLEATMNDGLIQTTDYMDRVGADEGYLLIFNRARNTPWEDKIFVKEERYGKHRVGIFGA